MEEFYKNILLDKSHLDVEKKYFTFNSDDINKCFKKLGYKEYCFGGFSYVFTKKELSQLEIEKFETEAQTVIDRNVDEITKDINKRILDKIFKKRTK